MFWFGRKALLMCLAVGFFPAAALSNVLPTQIAETLDRYSIPISDVSIEIRDIEKNEPILSINGDVSRNPASVIKLVTTLAALELIGPHHQWTTKYYAYGRIEDDMLIGDLVLKGGGDPFLTADKLWNHVTSLRGLGIRSISGNLLIDNTLYDIPAHDRSAFDNAPNRLYNVGPDAALVNFSATRLVVQPLSGKITVRAEPPLENISLNNRLVAKSGRCRSKAQGWNYRIDNTATAIQVGFSGAYPTNCGAYSISRSVMSNNEYTYRLFNLLWTQSGGRLGGSYRIGRLPEESLLLSSHSSTLLSDAIKSINKFSNNVMARMLFLNLDIENQNKQATLPGARKKIANWLSENNIDIPDLYIDNGSGLSRITRITANGVAELLQLGWNSLYRPEFLSSLPILAKDGTVRKRLFNSPIAGRARIKTGSVKGVRSMAGYLIGDNGKPYSVTVLIQSDRVTFHKGNRIQDAILKWVHSTTHR